MVCWCSGGAVPVLCVGCLLPSVPDGRTETAVLGIQTSKLRLVRDQAHFYRVLFNNVTNSEIRRDTVVRDGHSNYVVPIVA